jgi:predicted DNA-binding protein with PD1-like motif
MQFTHLGDIFIIRLERGEEIHATLITFCQQQNITAGWITGIGAVSQAELGYFHRDTKDYSWRRVTTDHELTSLMGNISLKEGEIWLHLHATLSDEQFQVTAGHLKSGVISVTGEIFLHPLPGTINRKLDPAFNSFLLDLPDKESPG